ncbi:MAG TPA: hypothetical protein VL283_04490, partial [Candidatus Baltobacteraceae bacterium]|nr:hypothetical protein [Candidatus Baltobacteraceae bacterium]
MNLSGLTRLIPVGWKGDTRALVDRLADRHAFEASAAQRDAIARRADAFLASPSVDEAAARALKFDLASADWKTRARAAARLSGDGAWTSWGVMGSMGGDGADDARAHGDAR